MTLLITLIFAIVCTLVWYKNAPHDTMKVSTLCYMYWGASLMWLADAIFEYAEEGAEYFNPPLEDILNDTLLGVSVVVFGLVIWVVRLLISDPKGVLKASFTNRLK